MSFLKSSQSLALRHAIRTHTSKLNLSTSFSTSARLPAAWWDLGNMGNYGEPGHYELPANGIGSRPKDHVTKTWDKNNIQNTYSYDGREAKMNAEVLEREGRTKDDSGGSAITERDVHNANKKAKVEFPEAPGPVIGMNDERGASGTINDPLGNRMVGTSPKHVPPQANENLMKWKVTEETKKMSGRMDEDGGL